MNRNLCTLKKSEYKELFTGMVSEIDKICIYLIIYDFDFDPDIITEKTELKPYKTEKKGLKHKRKYGMEEYISESNYWEIEYKHENVQSCEEAINGFMETIINPHKEYFREILKTANGKLLFVYYTYRSTNMGIWFEKDFVNILSELNLSIDLDLYCLYE